MAATCATCPFRVEVGIFLECRDRSPSAEPITGAAVWPRVTPTDFCRQHPDFEPAPPPVIQPALPL